MSIDAPSRARDRTPLGLRSVVSEPAVSDPPAALPRGAAPEARRRLRPRGREWILERLGWLGFAGLLLSVGVTALSAAGTAVLLPPSLRPVPSSLAGAFGQGGVDLGLGGLIAVSTLMFVSYAALVMGADRLTARPVLIGIACLNLLVLLGPPLLSTDVFSYIAYGRIGAVYGFNPYVSGPSAIALDPMYPYIGAQWIKTPTAYGPLFTAVSYVLAHLSIAANVLTYKTLAAISSLVVALVAWGAARLRGLNPVKAVAIVGLNPVVVVYGVGGGHNDLVMLAILMTGVYVLLQHRQRASGALIVAAAAVKLSAGLMLPFALARSGVGPPGARGRRAVLIGAGLAAGAIAALSFAVFGIGPLHLVGTLQGIQSNGGLHSIPGLFLMLIGRQELVSDIGVLLDGVLLIAVVLLARRVWMGTLDWITAAGWATVVMLCTAGLLVPWYVAWLVPLAALSRDRRLIVATVMLTGLGLTTL